MGFPQPGGATSYLYMPGIVLGPCDCFAGIPHRLPIPYGREFHCLPKATKIPPPFFFLLIVHILAFPLTFILPNRTLSFQKKTR